MDRQGFPQNLDERRREPSQAPFDGFPYLVTRIGNTPLRHIALLPVDWTRDHLVETARRQAFTNRLDTCLTLGPADALYITADGAEVEGRALPSGIPVIGRLHLPADLQLTPELRARLAALQAFVERHPAAGYLVGDGLEGGHRATAEDVRRLAGRDEHDVPQGLCRCPECGLFRGEYLALKGEGNGDKAPRVIPVCCRCQNHNRCARCGATLAEWRLSAYGYDEAARSVLYLAAYVALGHRCPAGGGFVH